MADSRIACRDSELRPDHSTAEWPAEIEGNCSAEPISPKQGLSVRSFLALDCDRTVGSKVEFEGVGVIGTPHIVFLTFDGTTNVLDSAGEFLAVECECDRGTHRHQLGVGGECPFTGLRSVLTSPVSRVRRLRANQ